VNHRSFPRVFYISPTAPSVSALSFQATLRDSEPSNDFSAIYICPLLFSQHVNLERAFSFGVCSLYDSPLSSVPSSLVATLPPPSIGVAYLLSSPTEIPGKDRARSHYDYVFIRVSLPMTMSQSQGLLMIFLLTLYHCRHTPPPPPQNFSNKTPSCVSTDFCLLEGPPFPGHNA